MLTRENFPRRMMMVGASVKIWWNRNPETLETEGLENREMASQWEKNWEPNRGQWSNSDINNSQKSHPTLGWKDRGRIYISRGQGWGIRKKLEARWACPVRSMEPWRRNSGCQTCYPRWRRKGRIPWFLVLSPFSPKLHGSQIQLKVR